MRERKGEKGDPFEAQLWPLWGECEKPTQRVIQSMTDISDRHFPSSYEAFTPKNYFDWWEIPGPAFSGWWCRESKAHTNSHHNISTFFIRILIAF